MSEYTKIYEEKMTGAVHHLGKELSAIRAGRANPAILDRVTVDYYGTPTPINQMAAVAVAEARILTITPWDPSLIHPIEHALLVSDIGINPTNDGRVIRLVFPSPTEERRRQLTKDVQKLGEEAKIAVRNVRREAMDALKKMKNNKELSEDESKSCEQDVEKKIASCIEEIDKAVAAKEKELLTV